MDCKSSNKRNLLLVMLTSHDESRALTVFREKCLRQTLERARRLLPQVDLLIIPIEKFFESELPKTDWVFILRPGDIPVPSLIDSAIVAFDRYNAIWGGILVRNIQKNSLDFLDGTIFGCTDMPKLIFRNPEKWLVSSFFIKMNKIIEKNQSSCLKLTFALKTWYEQKCIKLGVPFVIQSGVQDYMKNWEIILNYFRSTAILKKFDFDGHNLVFRIAYWNPYIESKLVSGHIFEDSQLLALKKIIKPGAIVIDIGANIGQHTIFFAKNMAAERVIPIEPNPDFSAILKENILLNDVQNVDTKLLNFCVGEEVGNCIISSSKNNPQNTSVNFDINGRTPVYPLDDLIADAVDLIKIDVDEHEIEVIRGMKRILRTFKPVLAVEVLHDNLTDFLSIMREFDYKIDHLFPNPQYNDIVAIPKLV